MIKVCKIMKKKNKVVVECKSILVIKLALYQRMRMKTNLMLIKWMYSWINRRENGPIPIMKTYKEKEMRLCASSVTGWSLNKKCKIWITPCCKAQNAGIKSTFSASSKYQSNSFQKMNMSIVLGAVCRSSNLR